MKTIFRTAVVITWAAVVTASPAVAGEHCLHADCGSICRIYVIDSHRHVPEIQYREIEFKIPKKRCETCLVEEKSEVVKLSYDTVVEPGEATIKVPHCKLETHYVSCKECRAETTYKPVTVDVGHAECVCQRVGLCGKLVATRVWVPKYVETYVPCTEIVCREALVPKTRVECQERPVQIKFPVEKSVVRFNKEELIRHVPVTTERCVEEVVKIRVPFATTRCVSCRQIFKPGDCPPRPIKTREDGCNTL